MNLMANDLSQFLINNFISFIFTYETLRRTKVIKNLRACHKRIYGLIIIINNYLFLF